MLGPMSDEGCRLKKAKGFRLSRLPGEGGDEAKVPVGFRGNHLISVGRHSYSPIHNGAIGVGRMQSPQPDWIKKSGYCVFVELMVFSTKTQRRGKRLGANVMKRVLSESRIQEALTKLKQNIGEGGFTVADAEKILDLSKRSVSLILGELAEEGLVVRTGRGTYAFDEKPIPSVVPETLPEESRRLYSAFADTGIQFALSCLDILLDYTHLMLRRYPHFSWVQSGSEDWTMEVVEGAGFVPLRNPNQDQLNTALELMPANELAVIRGTTIFYAAKDGLASIERALADLYYEVTRKRYPLDGAELLWIYYNVLTSTSVQYPRMLRYAGLRRFRDEIEWVLWKFKDRTDLPATYIKKPRPPDRFVDQLPSLDTALR